MVKDVECAFSSWELQSDAVKVEPLRYAEVSKAVKSGVAANLPDPLSRYLLYDNPDVNRSVFLDQRYRVIYSLGISDAVHRHVAFTVNHGDSLIILEPAPNSLPPKKCLERIAGAVRGTIVRYLELFNSKEQKKRSKEFKEQVEATLKTTIGDQVDDMMLLEGFCTTPDKQGRGYGTALAKHVGAIADAQGRSTWLLSSNVANTGYYENLDFWTVGEFSLGDNNPTWKKPPIIIRIMVRKPHDTAQDSDFESVTEYK
ncbi:hypothetical protein SCP_0504990 [Sparassis crispa]|uniref:N-acetyltransferase domain-containing protein n=1 Tax=Sparassis crispa TaxID=139825 RepID=A0A401GMP1_9APHY|nr:hypothetical protein SCP_0504990 [Sparassis crispa]GBE83450.1 hypothetical protein SCP_0504990 [Sparassis crispa]